VRSCVLRPPHNGVEGNVPVIPKDSAHCVQYFLRRAAANNMYEQLEIPLTSRTVTLVAGAVDQTYFFQSQLLLWVEAGGGSGFPRSHASPVAEDAHKV
jgi:hypothetical protein